MFYYVKAYSAPVILIIISVIVFSVGVGFDLKFLLLPSLAVGLFGPFFIILDYKVERVIKGLIVIILGIFWGVMFPEVYGDKIPDHFDHNFEIFKSMALFACSGAGGGIIASHAELSYKKDESLAKSETFIDKTMKIEILIESVERLRRVVVLTHVFYGVVLLVVVVFSVV